MSDTETLSPQVLQKLKDVLNRGDTEALDKMIDGGELPSTKLPSKEELTRLAIKGEHAEILEHMMRKGIIPIIHQDPEFADACMLRAAGTHRGNLDYVAGLSGERTHYDNDKLRGLPKDSLKEAVQHGEPDIIRYLISERPQILKQNVDSLEYMKTSPRELLDLAASSGRADNVAALLEAHPPLVFALDKRNGKTPSPMHLLHKALKENPQIKNDPDKYLEEMNKVSDAREKAEAELGIYRPIIQKTSPSSFPALDLPNEFEPQHNAPVLASADKGVGTPRNIPSMKI